MSFLPFLPAFSAWQFAAAGAICASAPIIIHLLNRRRYRVVHWAAMPFLREALKRNRKIMTLRDIILLILRTLAILLFGAAIARPFFSTSAQTFDRGKPLHAILVLDNSLSMGYTQLEGTLLDRAKDRAKQFIDELPDDSLVTLIPLCGSEAPISVDPYPSQDKPLAAAIDSIEVVDRSASVQRAVNEAQKATEAAPELAKRIVFISDQQAANWRDLLSAEQFQQLHSMQVVDVGPQDWENAWVADVRVQDGLADVETPTTFVVEVEHRAPAGAQRREIQVSLYVGDDLVSEKSLTLEGASGRREVTFEHTFSTLSPAAGQPEYVPVKAVISADNLLADNERHLVAPVVASLPVLFVDDVGPDEESSSRLGETIHLRKLLAPSGGGQDRQRQLIQVKHVALDGLTQSELEDARLVVVAGIRDPGNAATVALLRDYVAQGGQLVIGAGGEFDPARWTDLAWLDGQGILPAPLAAEPVGQVATASVGELNPLFLSFESLRSHYYFQLGDTAEEQLRDLYSDPLFFKYVQAEVTDETLSKLRESESQRLAQQWSAVGDDERLRTQLQQKDAAGQLDDEGRRTLAAVNERLQAQRPVWLRWRAPSLEDEISADPTQRDLQLEAQVSATLPTVRARFTSENGPAYLIERRIGRGNVLLVTSGLSTHWNTLPKTDTFFVFDRILRSMIRSTLTERNYAPVERITLPLPGDDRDAQLTLRRPGGDEQPLDPGFIGQEQLGVTVNKPLARGIYRLTAVKPSESAAPAATAQPAWVLSFAVNGDSEESDLTALSRAAFEERAAGSEVRWVAAGQPISLAGAAISGQNSWKYLLLLVLLILLLEVSILAWPMLRSTPPNPAPAS